MTDSVIFYRCGIIQRINAAAIRATTIAPSVVVDVGEWGDGNVDVRVHQNETANHLHSHSSYIFRRVRRRGVEGTNEDNTIITILISVSGDSAAAITSLILITIR